MPALVWAVTVLHTLLMLGFAVLYPPFLNPDEAQHVDLILAVQEEKVVWAPGERRVSQAIVTAFAEASIYGIGQGNPQAVPLGSATIRAREDRQSFRELGIDQPGPVTELPNQLVQHPPLYYALAAGVLEVLPGSDAYRWDVTLGILRVLGALLVSPLPLLVFITGRKLSPERPWVPVAASSAVLLIPGLTRAGGSVNNDNLLILLSAALLVPVAALLATPASPGRRTAWGRAAAIGVLMGLVAFTKGTGLVMLVLLGLAYGLACVRQRRVIWQEMLTVGIVATAVGGWWWVRNLLVYGTLQPIGLGAEALARVRGPAAPADVERSAAGFVIRASWKLAQLFVGALGQFTPPRLSPWLVSTMAVVAVVGVLAALVLRGAIRRADAVCFVVPVLFLYGYLLLAAYPWYLHNLSYPGLQGRYFYFLLPGLLLSVAAGWETLTPRVVRPVAPVAVCLAGVAMQAWAAWRIFSFLWDGLPGADWTVSSVERGVGVLVFYAPWPPPVTVAIPVAVTLAAGAVLLVAWRHVRGHLAATARRTEAGPPVS